MRQSDKELLLRDLAARLPYGVKVNFSSRAFDLGYVDKSGEIGVTLPDVARFANVVDVKPYLRPLSSMTEEEKIDFRNWQINTGNITFDWLNAHHFDYRKTKEGKTMIEAGLALEAPSGMYNVKD